MKKILMFLCAVILVFWMGGATNALSVTFTDTTVFTASGTILEEDYVNHGWGDVNFLDGYPDFVRWTHHFDFDPAAVEVLSGNLEVSLSDDQITWEKYIFDDLMPEYGFGWSEDGTWDIGEINTESYNYSVNASYLLDGEFTVTVCSLFGDFYIDRSDLEITYNPVPEPATMLLLASGLAGMGVLGRKKFIKQ